MASVPAEGTGERHWGEKGQAGMGLGVRLPPHRLPSRMLGGRAGASSTKRCKAPCPPLPLLGERRVEQPEDPPYQVQAPGDQDTDSGRLPQQHGPAAGGRVGVSPRRGGCCQPGVPALGHPPQRLGQAWENKGWGIEGPRGRGDQEQGTSGGGWLQQPPSAQGGLEPEVLPPLLLQQPRPRSLVLQAAGQGVLQRHIEVLLVWEAGRWGSGIRGGPGRVWDQGGVGGDPGSPALTCIAGHRHLREIRAKDSVIKVAGLRGEAGQWGGASAPTHGISTGTSPTLAELWGFGPGTG